MEDLEQSSLEEKVDLGNFVLFPLDSYVKKQRRQISDLKMNLQKSKPVMIFLKIMISKMKQLNYLLMTMKWAKKRRWKSASIQKHRHLLFCFKNWYWSRTNTWTTRNINTWKSGSVNNWIWKVVNNWTWKVVNTWTWEVVDNYREVSC